MPKMSMDVPEDQGRKRSRPTESDSDTKIPTHRSKYHPVPNIEIARQRDESTAKKQSVPALTAYAMKVFHFSFFVLMAT